MMLESEISRRVFIVSACMFIVMLGAGIVSPILPRYAENFGVSYSLVGLTISSFGLARVIFDVPSGSLSDRFGRRHVTVFGMLLFSSAGFVAAYAQIIEHLIVARFVQGVGAAIYSTSTLAYVADLVPPERRGRHLGNYQSAFFLGGVVGPVMGGFLTFIGGIRMPFLVLSALGLVGAVFTYRSLEESPNRKTDGRHGSHISSVFSQLFSSKAALIANLAGIVTFIMMSGVKFTALPIFGRNYVGLGELEIGIILSATSTVNFLVVRWTGILIDRIGALASLFYGFIASGIIVALFTLTRDLTSMILVAGLLGASTAVVIPAKTVLIIGATDPSHRGLSLGVFRLFQDLGLIVGPVITGIILDRFEITAPFFVVAGICLGVAMVVAAYGRRVALRGLSARPSRCLDTTKG